MDEANVLAAYRHRSSCNSCSGLRTLIGLNASPLINRLVYFHTIVVRGYAPTARGQPQKLSARSSTGQSGRLFSAPKYRQTDRCRQFSSSHSLRLIPLDRTQILVAQTQCVAPANGGTSRQNREPSPEGHSTTSPFQAFYVGRLRQSRTAPPFSPLLATVG